MRLHAETATIENGFVFLPEEPRARRLSPNSPPFPAAAAATRSIRPPRRSSGPGGNRPGRRGSRIIGGWEEQRALPCARVAAAWAAPAAPAPPSHRSRVSSAAPLLPPYHLGAYPLSYAFFF